MSTTQDVETKRPASPAKAPFNPESPPEFQTTRWFNTAEPLSLAKLKGRVVVLVGFQMLCPSCVQHALPQAKRLADRFSDDEVVVIGLHMVFEHRKAMGPEALEAFITQFGWTFPIGVDAADGAKPPKTMAAYELRGTPTVLLFDRQGRLRRHYLGQADDIRLAAEIMALSIEARDAPREAAIAIERRLHAVLVDPSAHDQHHHHDHDGGCCGGHH